MRTMIVGLEGRPSSAPPEDVARQFGFPLCCAISIPTRRATSATRKTWPARPSSTAIARTQSSVGCDIAIADGGERHEAEVEQAAPRGLSVARRRGAGGTACAWLGPQAAAELPRSRRRVPVSTADLSPVADVELLLEPFREQVLAEEDVVLRERPASRLETARGGPRRVS